jgi:hypothetical protein
VEKSKKSLAIGGRKWQVKANPNPLRLGNGWSSQGQYPAFGIVVSVVLSGFPLAGLGRVRRGRRTLQHGSGNRPFL